MGDKTGIDRGGRRVRLYIRQDQTRPGQRERRAKAAVGLRWCRGCRDWLPATEISQGACRPCLATEERGRYAADDNFKEYRKGQRDRRRRAVDRMPSDGAGLILELFDGECAYCPAPATTWDHAIAVTRGGKTLPGNMLPACSSCNSRKRNRDIDEWIDQFAPAAKPFTVEYLTMSGVL